MSNRKCSRYEIENDMGVVFSVQGMQQNPFTQENIDEVLFVIEELDPREDLTSNGDLVMSMSKAKARKLIKELQRLTRD